MFLGAYTVQAQANAVIYGSGSLIHNEDTNTVTAIGMTEVDYAGQDWYAPRVTAWVTNGAGQQLFYGTQTRLDGGMTATVTTTFNAVSNEAYFFTARHAAPFYIRDMNLGGLYVDYWGFTPVYISGPEGSVVRWIYSPFYGPGPRYNSHGSTLFLGDSQQEALIIQRAELIAKATWDKLTNEEKQWVHDHVLTAVQFFILAEMAKSETAARFSAQDKEDGFRGNAFQHAYWNALMTSVAGGGEQLAAGLANAHENWVGNPPTHKNMDLYNNAVGRQIGLNNPFANAAQMANHVMTALNNGQLQVACPAAGPKWCRTLP